MRRESRISTGFAQKIAEHLGVIEMKDLPTVAFAVLAIEATLSVCRSGLCPVPLFSILEKRAVTQNLKHPLHYQQGRFNYHPGHSNYRPERFNYHPGHSNYRPGRFNYHPGRFNYRPRRSRF